MVPFLRELWGNPSSPYRFGSQARAAVEQARQRVAALVGCRPTELVFCASGSEADNLALRGAAHALRSRGRHLVTSSIEHHAVLNTCKALESEGFEVTYLPVTAAGAVETGALEASLRDDTTLVSVMRANNETGVVQPVEEIAAITRQRGVVLHTDAVQAVGKIGGTLTETGADLLTLSGHKLYGPKGSAALVVREPTPLVPVTTGGAHEHGLRAGTENVAGIVGFATALALVLEDAEAEGRRLGSLRDRLEAEVSARIPDVRVNGAGARRVPGTSSLSFAGVDGESVVLGLDLRGICVSTGSACSTGDPEPSHVLRAMGLEPREAQGSIRVSLGRDTRDEHVDATVAALVDTVARLRAISSVRGER